MPNYTPFYGLAQPLVNNPVDEDRWGDELNENMSIIDTALNTIATSGASGVPAGAISMYGGATAPSGWLLCFGQAVSRTGDNAALFTAIGTTYGVGDGATTFNLPDMRGRVGAGLDNMGGTPASRLTGSPTGGVVGSALGNVGGSQGHQLTSAQNGTHTHTVTVTAADVNATLYGSTSGAGGTGTPNDRIRVTGFNVENASGGSNIGTFVATGNHTHTASATNSGSGDSHNNVQPTIILNYIIKQ